MSTSHRPRPRPSSKTADRIVLRFDTFDALTTARGWDNDEKRARALGVYSSTIWRMRSGDSWPGAKFIHAAITTLGVRYEDLFERVSLRCNAPRRNKAA